MSEGKVCNWHLVDTRWGKNPTAVTIHTLVAEVNEYEFCMIDYAVNSLNGYVHEWNAENIQNAIDFCKPFLATMGVRGKSTLKGIDFPKVDIVI